MGLRCATCRLGVEAAGRDLRQLLFGAFLEPCVHRLLFLAAIAAATASNTLRVGRSGGGKEVAETCSHVSDDSAGLFPEKSFSG